MEYKFVVNKQYKYMRIYNIVKKVSGNPNIISKAIQSLVDKYIVKKKPL
ncbi:MAG: hypothetical protein M1611_02375 [Candidatus Marsarchaeota archaeon]|jgi:hypothetical protein|nr:hypothetical protein [Candidatus Marsarchaeota archaeon]